LIAKLSKIFENFTIQIFFQEQQSNQPSKENEIMSEYNLKWWGVWFFYANRSNCLKASHLSSSTGLVWIIFGFRISRQVSFLKKYSNLTWLQQQIGEEAHTLSTMNQIWLTVRYNKNKLFLQWSNQESTKNWRLSIKYVEPPTTAQLYEIIVGIECAISKSFLKTAQSQETFGTWKEK
jgi:hypothetical protein